MTGVTYTMFGAFAAVALVSAGTAQEPLSGTTQARVPTCTTSGCHVQTLQHLRLHEPVERDRCDVCHEPKPGATPYAAGVRHEFKRAGDNPELCYACHDRLGQASFVHEPVKMGVCILCHDPHGSDKSSLLRVDTDSQLCNRCHRLTFDQNEHVHPPVNDGTCGACHNSHGSDHEKFLHEAQPDLCLGCHDTIEELLDDSAVTHDVVSTGRSCVSCHNPHSSAVERLLVQEPMGLCLSCHDEELESGGGKIRNIAKHLQENPNHHGPIKDQNCLACHLPHGGDVSSLLTEANPAEPYASYDEDGYALCLGCHDVEMVEEERDEEATEFRNGDMNLHYLHVNREEKGVTCGVCHDPHAGTGQKHIAAPNVFGEQAILVKYEATATGGSCISSCHTTWAYDRDKPASKE